MPGPAPHALGEELTWVAELLKMSVSPGMLKLRLLCATRHKHQHRNLSDSLFA